MTESVLWIIVGLLVLIAWQLQAIGSRLKARFPSDKEEDSRWAQEDPLGHWEAHKGEGQSAKKKD